MTAICHLEFSYFLVTRQIGMASVHCRTKFHQNGSNGCWNIAIYPFFFKMAAIRHFGFLELILGRPTTRIWWSLSLCKCWLELH